MFQHDTVSFQSLLSLADIGKRRDNMLLKMYSSVPPFGGVTAAALAIIILVFVTLLCLRLFSRARLFQPKSPDSETGHCRVTSTEPTSLTDLENLQQTEEKPVAENVHEKYVRERSYK